MADNKLEDSQLRVVGTWNDLPEEVVNAPSVNAFKYRLDKHWKDEELVLNYKMPISRGRKVV